MNIIWLGVYGYFLPANQRVGLSVPQVTTTLTMSVCGYRNQYLHVQGLRVHGGYQVGYSVEGGNLCYLPACDFIYLVDGSDGVHPFGGSSVSGT